ncbi:MAG: hypothetical protein R3Y63_07735 [Eubacteriales bacterium]
MYFEKRFGAYSKTVTLDSKQSKKLIMVLFSVIGLVFMLVGGIFLAVNPSPDDYTKTGEYEFFFHENLRKTSTSRSRSSGISRSTTSTNYVPMYLGFVGEDSYTYEYHRDFSSEVKAQEFTNANQTMLVSTYFNQENQLFFLASDITLEEYFNQQALFGYIFFGFGVFFFIIGLCVGLFPKKKNKDAFDYDIG